MNEFLHALEEALSGMDAEQRREILADYEEHFALGREAGKTDRDISRSLGDPHQLARMYTALGAAHRARQGGFADAMRMIGAALRYQVGGGLLMGALYFLCFGAIALLFVTAASLFVIAVGCIVVMGMEIARGLGAYAALTVFLALFFASGGLLWIFGNTWLWKTCAKRLPLLAHRIMKHSFREAL